jgi:hypothetical protein
MSLDCSLLELWFREHQDHSKNKGWMSICVSISSMYCISPLVRMDARKGMDRNEGATFDTRDIPITPVEQPHSPWAVCK